MIQKKPKELLAAVADMGTRLLLWHPLLTLVAASWLTFQGVDMYMDHVKDQKLKPRIEYSQQMMNDIVENGREMCDPARSRPGAEAELRQALERKMFIVPEKIGDETDARNMRNGMNMQWATALGVKLCVDTQMEQGTAIIWHPKEKILAVNGGYHANLLAMHLEVAINELARRGSNDRYRSPQRSGANEGIPPLSEKFFVQTTPKFPTEYMIHDETELSQTMRNLLPPIRPGPKNGS